eukprot:m.308843 g.308843  ORF g.308843 m.308843 type:complete len:1299 (-) comp15942_c1_seq18:2571-6467(-)
MMIYSAAMAESADCYPSELPKASSKFLSENGLTWDKEWLLGGKCVGDAGVKILAECLRLQGCPVTSIMLGSNKVSAEGAKYLAEAMKHNSTVTKIDLRWNAIKDEGMVHLANVISLHPSLQELNFYENSIGPVGAKHLAEALETNSSVLSIDLSGNKIADEGLAELAKSLCKNTTLESISLKSTDISHAGVSALVKTLEQDITVLKHIDLVGNRLGGESAAQLVNALKVNSSVTSLSGVEWGPHQEEVDRLLQRNKFAFGSHLLPSNRCMVGFVGTGGSGKTSTLNSLEGLRFDSTRKSTRGAAIREFARVDRSANKFAQCKPTSELVRHAIAMRRMKQDKAEKQTAADKLEKSFASVAVEQVSVQETASVSSRHSTEESTQSAQTYASQPTQHPSPHEAAIAATAPLQRRMSQKTRERVETRASDIGKLVAHMVPMQDAVQEEDAPRMTMLDMGGQSQFWPIASMFQRSGSINCVFSRIDALLAAIAQEGKQIDARTRPVEGFILRRMLGSLTKRTIEWKTRSDTNLLPTQELLLWLDSILFSDARGDIMIVLTFGDTLLQSPDSSENPQLIAINSFLCEKLSKHPVWPLLVKNKTTGFPFFVIDNTKSHSDEGIKCLISALQVSAVNSVMTKTKLPVWVRLLQDALTCVATCELGQVHMLAGTKQVIEKIITEKGKPTLIPVLSRREAKAIAETIHPHLTDAVLDSALAFLHNLNALTYYPSQGLRDSVLLSPKWFIDAATTIIRDPVLHPIKAIDNNPENKAMLDKLYQSAVLGEQTLIKLLKDYDEAEKSLITRLMLQNGLLVPLTSDPSQSGSQMLVPSLLHKSDERLMDEAKEIESPPVFRIVVCNVQQKVQYIHTTNDFPCPPAGFFSKVQAGLVRFAQSTRGNDIQGTMRPILSQNYVSLYIGLAPVELTLQPDESCITVVLHCENGSLLIEQILNVISDVQQASFPTTMVSCYVPHQSGFVLFDHIKAFHNSDKVAIILNQMTARRDQFEKMFAKYLKVRSTCAYDVFISYRQGTNDSKYTAQLFHGLDQTVLPSGSRPNVFYDNMSLKAGKRFDEAFMAALSVARVVVPFLSVDALERMVDPANLETVDNVLLEWAFTLYLEHHGVVSKVVPIIIGPVSGSDAVNATMKDFFRYTCEDGTTRNILEELPDAVNEATYKELHDFICKRSPRAPRPEKLTVKDIVTGISKFSTELLCWKYLAPGDQRTVDEAEMDRRSHVAPRTQPEVPRTIESDLAAMSMIESDLAAMSSTTSKFDTMCSVWCTEIIAAEVKHLPQAEAPAFRQLGQTT